MGVKKSELLNCMTACENLNQAVKVCLVCVWTYTGMGERVGVIIDDGDGKVDIMRICLVGLQPHLNRLGLNSQKYTQNEEKKESRNESPKHLCKSKESYSRSN